MHIGGGPGIIDAIGKRTGPSWRMLIEPGKGGLAFGVYPGGQSGNPGSFYYDNFIPTWIKGQINPLVFMRSESESQEIISRIILRPLPVGK